MEHRSWESVNPAGGGGRPDGQLAFHARHSGKKPASKDHPRPEHATMGQPASSARLFNGKRPLRNSARWKSGQGVVLTARACLPLIGRPG